MTCRQCSLLPCYSLRAFFFIYYKVGDFNIIKMKNSIHSKIIEICDVYFKTNVGCKLTLKDIRHVPYLYLNMMFDICFGKVGLRKTLWKRQWKLIKASLVVKK